MSESRTTETDAAPSRSAEPTSSPSAAHAAHPSDAPAAARPGRRRAPARRLAALRPFRSDHPAHTLIFAFAGSALNTLVIIYAYSMPYLQYMNEYEIGIEIMRGLSGSFGIILTVPFVSFACAALLARRKHQTSVNAQVAVGK